MSARLDRRLRPTFNQIFELKDSEGNLIYPIFQKMPEKKFYPDYYEIIANPISLNSVKTRLPRYRKPQEFVNDLAQITWNARTYNSKESFVYTHALILDAFIHRNVIPKFLKSGTAVTYPDLGNLPDSNGNMVSYDASEVNETPADIFIPEPIEQDESFIEDSPVPELVSGGGEDEDEYEEEEEYTTRRPKKVYQKEQANKRGRPPVIDKPYEQRIKNVLRYLKKEKSEFGFVCTPFERYPDPQDFPGYYDVIKNPISLEDVKKKVKQRKYATVDQFIADFQMVINNAKEFHEPHTKPYRQAVVLEASFKKYMNAELRRPDTDYVLENFPLEILEWKEKKFKVGDWVLVKNPNDPTKPTVGQIFKIWVTPQGQRFFNACWYLRPEQTVHRVDRLFYKNEVVKSGQYRDHSADELVGKCYVVHFTKYQRGDPDFEYEGPLFICEFRYNETSKDFNKIRTWKACLPDEVRGREDPFKPVNGRKFFKYESPIKHLLPPNATNRDPIPNAVYATRNAPPVVGAVYLRDPIVKDDLGEYSTSVEVPRYVIRPGDPSEGVVDYEHGTTLVDQQTVQPTKASARAVGGAGAVAAAAAAVSRLPLSKTSSATKLSSTQYTPPAAVMQQHQQLLSTYQSSHTVSTFTLPIPLTRNVEGLNKTAEGEVIWYKGPGVCVQDRFMNVPDVGLNRWRKRVLGDEELQGEDEELPIPGAGYAGLGSLKKSAAYCAWKLRKTNA